MRILFSSLLTFGLLVAAPGALAQASQPGPQGAAPGGAPSGMPPSQQKALMMAQMQLMQAQQKALNDPKILQERQKIRTLMETEMLKQDPTLKATLKRFHELEEEGKKMQAQQAAGTLDMTKAQALMAEMGTIGPKLETAQKKVMDLPHVKKATDAFEKKLEAKMREIDPEVPAAKAMIEKFNPNAR